MSQSELAELYRLIRDLTAEVSTLTVAVARVEEQMTQAKDLQGEQKAMGERVTSLEMDRARWQGVSMAGKALWAFIGAGGLGLVTGLVMLIRHKP